jgi:hypothetical protein
MKALKVLGITALGITGAVWNFYLIVYGVVIVTTLMGVAF